MAGFKEDFEAWRKTLTREERKLYQEQEQGKYNKAYRKSEDFKKQAVPPEKQAEFEKILDKFMETYNEKDQNFERKPDYDGLLKKAGGKELDTSLRFFGVEVDRQAERRYKYASERIRHLEKKGEKFPESSPLQEIVFLQNNDTESHEFVKLVWETMEQSKETAPEETKKIIDELLAKGVPPMGENLEYCVPFKMVEQVRLVVHFAEKLVEDTREEKGEEEAKKIDEALTEAIPQAISVLEHNYVTARDEVEAGACQLRDFFRSHEKVKDKYKTKADVWKSFWSALGKYSKEPIPPIDEDFLADLEKIPAVREGDISPWATEDELWKSEAIDSFGVKYLLGIFKTKEEAKQAFDAWNAEYEDARKNQKEEIAQWSKKEQARLDKLESTEGVQKIRKIIEEARAAATR